MIFAISSSLHLSTTPLVRPSHNFSEFEIIYFNDCTRDCVGSVDVSVDSAYSARNIVAALDNGKTIVAVRVRERRLAQKSKGPGGLPLKFPLGGIVVVRLCSL